MFSPLTKILIKVFGYGFYKVHSGLLFFLFVSVISFCFFVTTGGHMAPEDRTRWNVAFTLLLISNPMMMLFYFAGSLFYSYKSVQYIFKQLSREENLFLFYSSTSLKKGTQYISWLTVLLFIMLPLFVYLLYAIIIGVAFHYYVIPGIMLLFFLLLLLTSAYLPFNVVNRLKKSDQRLYLSTLTKQWSKPFYTLYTYYVLNSLKVTYVVTKTLSIIFITIGFYSHPEVQYDTRMACLVILSVVLAHIVLVYQEYNFNETYLSLAYNFPINKLQAFYSYLLNYLLLLLPEIVWICTFFSFPVACQLVLLVFSLLALFRSSTYWIGLNVKRYLKFVFLISAIFFLGILFGYIWILIIVSQIIAYFIFARNYFLKNGIV